MLLRMNLWRRGLLLLLGSLSPLPAESSGVMMRMEGIYDGENTCVLLNRSGDYRLERYFVYKTKVCLGVLPAQDVREIQAVLDACPLAQLSQAGIHRVMNNHTFDKLSIDISREKGTQSLVFFDPESREPFRESLNPIMRWLSKVKSEPSTKIATTSANHCLPGVAPTSPPHWSAPIAN